jgi:hypothetical protein
MLLIQFYTFSHYTVFYSPCPVQMYVVVVLSIEGFLPVCESGKFVSKVKDENGEVMWNGVKPNHCSRMYMSRSRVIHNVARNVLPAT